MSLDIFDDVAAFLIAAGLATAKGTDIFGYNFSPTPANQIIIIPGDGGPAGHECGASDPVLEPTVQIQVRNTSLTAAELLANQIWDALDGADISEMSLDGSRSGPASRGQDENGWHKFSLDFDILGE